jgi:hypothetical protein
LCDHQFKGDIVVLIDQYSGAEMIIAMSLIVMEKYKPNMYIVPKEGALKTDTKEELNPNSSVHRAYYNILSTGYPEDKLFVNDMETMSDSHDMRFCIVKTPGKNFKMSAKCMQSLLDKMVDDGILIEGEFVKKIK